MCHPLAAGNSTKVLFENYSDIHATVQTICEDTQEKLSTRDEAKAIMTNLRSFNIAFMTVFWHSVLQRFNATSSKLQEKTLDLSVGVKLLKSLVGYVAGIRDDFQKFEDSAHLLGSFVSREYDSERQRKRTRKIAFDESREGDISLSHSAKFRIESFLPVIDNLTQCLRDRLEAYESVETRFGFLTSFKTMSSTEISVAAETMGNIYDLDLGESFPDEMIQFKNFIEEASTPSPQESLKVS